MRRREPEAGLPEVSLACAPVMYKRSGARLWFLAFIGFCLLHAGWALAEPYNGPPDERQHAFRAAGIMHGEIVTGPDNIHTVPDSLNRGSCFPMNAEIAASCEREPEGDETPKRFYDSAARYNPVYYIVTGWPLGWWPNWRGIMLSRLLNGAAMAALLAGAVVAASRWTRYRALLAGVVVATTPMIAHLGGAINPNGVEIAAGVALFAALIAVVHEQREGVNRAAVALAGVSASVLVTPRFSGLMWLVVILGVILVPAPWARIRTLARSRAVRAWSAVVVTSTLASAAWTILVRTTEIQDSDLGYTMRQILRNAVLNVWPNVTNEMVGVMGWLDTPLPRLIYVVWFMAVGLLLLGGLALGNLADRWRLLALLFGTFAPLLLAEMVLVNQIGWFNQGRYFLPAATGLPLLGAHILAHHGLTAEQMRSITRMLAILLVPIHLACLLYTMTRWQSGLTILNPFKGSWMPPYGVVLPLASATLGTAVLLTVYWWASRIPAHPPLIDVDGYSRAEPGSSYG